MAGYALTSLVLIGLFPFLPVTWDRVDVVAVCVVASLCVRYGRRATQLGRRRPWTLLAWALLAFAAGNLLQFVPGEHSADIGGFASAAGYVLAFAAGLAFIVWRGATDVGGVLDSVVIALAGGAVIWYVVDQRLGPDSKLVDQVQLFVALFALTGMFGALLRLATTGDEPDAALWWLIGAAALAICGKVALALAGVFGAGHDGAVVVLLAALTAMGLFGLDPTGPRLAQPRPASTERFSRARLTFLGIAVAFIPLAKGALDLFDGEVAGGLVLLVPGVIAVLVMARIGLLASQHARDEERLHQQATHDPLTQLPNRRHFAQRLGQELDRAARCALLFCDLDGFKAVNDRLGHDAGDAVLIEVAGRLRACVSEVDVVSRIGGDEFVVLLVNSTQARDEAVRSCIEEAVRHPIELAGGVRIDISVGLAVSDGVRDPEQLIRSADHEMYQVKAARGSARPASHSNRAL